MKYLFPLLLVAATPALADPLTNLLTVMVDQRIQCPDVNPCKIVVITAQEEKILTGERGILATAAQARALDLGSLATYFEQKISKAPAGDPKEVPKPETPSPK